MLGGQFSNSSESPSFIPSLLERRLRYVNIKGAVGYIFSISFLLDADSVAAGK